MATEFRKTGISVVGDVPWGSHFCHFYETKQDLLDTLVPYFKAGLENNECCLWVVSGSDLITVAEAKEALAQAVPDLDRHLSAENIEILNGHDWYFDKNLLNLERVKSEWDAKVKGALARGYDGLRASADTFWLAGKDWKDFFAYEKQVNDWITDQTMTVLCTYPLAKSGATEVLDVVQAHQFAIARRQGEWEVIESPEAIQAKAEIKRLNEELQQVPDRRSQPPAIVRYGVAVLSVIAAVIILLLMDTGLQAAAYVSVFLCAVIFSSWFGGIRPGLLAIVLSTLAFAYVLPPPQSLAVGITHLPRLLLFALLAFFVASLTAAQQSKAESLRHARDVLHETVQELKRTNVALQAENAERKRSEDALRQSEDRNRLIIDTIPTMAWSLQPEGAIDFVNQRWMDYTGLSLEQAIAEPTRPMHPEDLPGAMAEWGENMAAKEPFEDEMRLRRADGEYRWFLVRTDPLRDEQGNVVKWYGASIDIEDRKQAEEQLQQRESQLAEAQRLAHVGSWEWNLRSNSITWSDELYRIFGLQPGKMNVPGDAMPFIHPEDRDLVFSTVQSAVKNKEPFSFYYRVLRPDGGERIAHSRGHIVSDERGEPIRVFGATQDVTERKQAEEALREAEQKYRDIFENAGEGIFQSTPEGRYIAANPALARMYGFASPEELIDSRHDISRQVYVDPTRREEFRSQLEEQGAVLGFEHEVFRKDGSRLWISVNARAVRDEQGAIQYYEGTAQDITERKAAEEKLKATSEQLRALSARLQAAREEEGTRIAREIHDEMGSTLTSLRWELERFDKTISESEDWSQLQALRAKIQDMMKLTDNTIGTMRRITSELRPSVLDDLGLSAAIEWQAQQFQARTGIICDCDCSLEKVELNEEQSTAAFRILQEALTNVLRHAEATRVDIKISQENGYLALSISDNGKGITDSEKSEQQSLGILGMRERAHLIGGEIDIKGVEGKGTVVNVRVPSSDQDRILKMGAEKNL